MDRKKKKTVKRKVYRFVLAFLLAAVCCNGCGNNRADTDNLIIIEKEKEEIQYSMTEASRGDVILTKQVRCSYLQMEDQDISFSVSGRRISRILVLDVANGLVSEEGNEEEASE